MKYILLLALILISKSSSAQERAFYGRIIDKDTRNGIPFSVAQLKDKNKGTYSDEQGAFSMKVNTDSVKTMLFYCLGYERSEVNIDNISGDSIIVELRKISTALNEIIVTPDKENLKEHILGKKDLQSSCIFVGSNGSEAAIFLKAKPSRHNFLKEVFFYVTDDGMPETKFRVHVYGIDSSGRYPGNDLTDSNVILHANNGNEWVGADLSSKKIPLGKGLFISVEWIKVGSYGAKMECGKRKRSVEEINCQVLAGTRDYDKEGSIFVKRSPFFKAWHYDDWHMFNPMIYGTYNHIK